MLLFIVAMKLSNIKNADVIVRSSAVDMDNPELEAARQARIPIVPVLKCWVS